jgi:hypothetical protein
MSDHRDAYVLAARHEPVTSDTHGPEADRATVPATATRGPLVLRIIGVAAAAALGIATFAVLGLAIAQLLDARGVIGNRGTDGLESLGYVLGGVGVGAATGLVVAVWVGLRVWQGRWALLVVLVGIAVCTGLTLALTAV